MISVQQAFGMAGLFAIVLGGIVACRDVAAGEPHDPAAIRKAIAEGAEAIEVRADNNVVIELLRIPPGEFNFGSPLSEEGHDEFESPLCRIKITKPFYLGKYEITQAQYRAVMGDNPGTVQGDTIAVNQITYRLARSYCEKISETVGLKVELPTEAQWEYACRAGTTTRFSSGDSEADLQKVAWYSENSGGQPHPVGQKAPNAFGLFDMHGNVSEICADIMRRNGKTSLTDPIGEIDQSSNACRGGSYARPSRVCRSAFRERSSNKFADFGFRIAINVEPKKAEADPPPKSK
jgi:formylglycine-generating enzyme required for sulfatase activity